MNPLKTVNNSVGAVKNSTTGDGVD